MGILKISKQISKNQIIRRLLSESQEGFLLIELMVSLMILIFFIYLMYRYQSMCIEVKYELVKRYEVTNLIHSFLAKASSNATLLQQENYVQDGCTLTWSLEDFPFKKIDTLALVTSKIRCLKLHAQWNGWNKKLHTMVVTSGITQ